MRQFGYTVRTLLPTRPRTHWLRPERQLDALASRERLYNSSVSTNLFLEYVRQRIIRLCMLWVDVIVDESTYDPVNINKHPDSD
jgi:hypothetical protein